MGKNKKKSEPTMSKPELSKRLLALMSNHPGESYNYKQLAMRLQVKSMGMKRQIGSVAGIRRKRRVGRDFDRKI